MCLDEKKPNQPPEGTPLAGPVDRGLGLRSLVFSLGEGSRVTPGGAFLIWFVRHIIALHGAMNARARRRVNTYFAYYARLRLLSVYLSALSVPMTATAIKRLRAKWGVTQTKFAGLFGVSPRTVQGWERGIKPSKTAILLMKQARNLKAK